jgi:acyl CoA:acetate/3-ketoacid CoA transferase
MDGPVDRANRFNATKLPSVLADCHSLINIAQSAKELIFHYTFTIQSMRCGVGDGWSSPRLRSEPA